MPACPASASATSAWLPRRHRHSLPEPRTLTGPHAKARRLGLAFVFLWFFIGGIAHFAATDTEMKIVPAWIPWPRETVYLSGVLELLGAAGLLWQRSRRAAGWGLFALTLAVTPANVYMLQHTDLFPNVPYWALVLRLPLQVALLALIVWSTVPQARPSVDDRATPPA